MTAIVNYALDDPLDVLPWIFVQKETDTASAGYFFLGLAGPAYLKTNIYPNKGGECLSEDAFERAMSALVQRCRTQAFGQDVIGLPIADEHRVSCLALFDQNVDSKTLHPIRLLLDRPFPDPMPLAFEIEDGVVYD